MSHRSPSPRCNERRIPSGPILTRAILLAAALLLLPATSPAEPPCGSFEPGPSAEPGPLGEAGVVASALEPAVNGGIVPLPTRSGLVDEEDAEPRAEALIAFPKHPNGEQPKLRADQLAPGARVVESFFSPVICSTVARVVGPLELDYSELVRGLPETTLVVPNPVYVTAVDEVRAAGDPYRSFQYGLDLAGVEHARALTNGRGVRLALLDSAPQSNHRDLGVIRTLDLLDGREPPAPALHGSLMAGVVGAIEGNGFGIAGVAPGVEILAIPVCRGDAYGTADACDLFDLLVGVDLAWENGAHIVNLSLVGPPNPLLSHAMDRLEALGILVVAAAGNEGTTDPRFPAAYASVIGVGAVDRDGKPYARGNQGVSVDVLAPGVEILSTVPGDRFAFGDGTSLAAAHVSGLLALALSTGGDLTGVRRAFFAAARARAPQPHDGPLPMPAACDVLAELGRPCLSTSGGL